MTPAEIEALVFGVPGFAVLILGVASARMSWLQTAGYALLLYWSLWFLLFNIATLALHADLVMPDLGQALGRSVGALLFALLLKALVAGISAIGKRAKR